LNVYVEATQEDYVFSDQDEPVNLAVGDTASYPGVFSEASYGNDYADGGFVSASGYYVGWDGENAFALHTSSGVISAYCNSSAIALAASFRAYCNSSTNDK